MHLPDMERIPCSIRYGTGMEWRYKIVPKNLTYHLSHVLIEPRTIEFIIGMERWVWNSEQTCCSTGMERGMERDVQEYMFHTKPCHDPLPRSRETPASTHLRVSPTTRQGPKKRNPGGLEHKTKKGRPNHDIDNKECWELPEYHKPAGPTGPSIRSSPKSKLILINEG